MDDREIMEERLRKATDEKIERDIKFRKRQIKVRGLKGFIVASALAITALTVLNMKHIDEDHLSYDEIKEEMYIHSGHAIGPDGNIVNPYLGHDCEVPYDGETSFTNRLRLAMEEEYSPEVIDETVALFDPMAYGNTEDFKEAKEQLDDIGNNIKKGEDGKYALKKKTKSY